MLNFKWTSTYIESCLDDIGVINRFTVTPLIYRIRDYYESALDDIPFCQEKRIEELERKIKELEAYIESEELLQKSHDRLFYT